MNERNPNEPEQTIEPRDEQSIEPRDEQLIDALLTRAVRPDLESDERLVQRFMNELSNGDGPEVAGSGLAGPVTSSYWWNRRWFPVSLGVAALIAFIVLAFPSGFGSNAALAALDRTIQSVTQPMTREYRVRLVSRGKAGRKWTRNCRLFVRQQNVAFESSALFGKGKIWAGGQDKRRWLVPRFGPVYVGTNLGKHQEIINQKLDQEVLETPFMSVERILQRTRRFYDLSIQEGVSLSYDERSFQCNLIIGKRKSPDRKKLPEVVRIWADPATGFARQIHLKWNPEDGPRWNEASARLVGTPDLPIDFFGHEYHHDGSRKVIQVD